MPDSHASSVQPVTTTIDIDVQQVLDGDTTLGQTLLRVLKEVKFTPRKPLRYLVASTSATDAEWLRETTTAAFQGTLSQKSRFRRSGQHGFLELAMYQSLPTEDTSDTQSPFKTVTSGESGNTIADGGRSKLLPKRPKRDILEGDRARNSFPPGDIAKRDGNNGPERHRDGHVDGPLSELDDQRRVSDSIAVVCENNARLMQELIEQEPLRELKDAATATQWLNNFSKRLLTPLVQKSIDELLREDGFACFEEWLSRLCDKSEVLITVIQLERVFAALGEFGADGASIPCVAFANRILQALAGKKIPKEHGEQVVSIIRGFATATHSQLTLDGLPVGVSINKSQIRNAFTFFVVRETGKTKATQQTWGKARFPNLQIFQTAPA